MKFSKAHIVLFLAGGLLVPIHANASVFNGGSVPEPLSLALLGAGLAGLGAAEMIRRRKRSKSQKIDDHTNI